MPADLRPSLRRWSVNLANNTLIDLLMNEQSKQLGQRIASQGADTRANPVVNMLMGWRGNAAQQQPTQPKPRAQARAQSIAPQQTQGQDVQARILARIKTTDETGLARPGEGMLPGMALRPEVRKLFEPAGGASMIDISNLSPEERNGLKMLIDPSWAQRQSDPEATLSPEEMAAAKKQYGG